MTNFKAVRDFFSEEEWQIIDYAISEYQDHLFENEGEQEIYDSIQDKLNQLFHEVQSWSSKSLRSRLTSRIVTLNVLSIFKDKSQSLVLAPFGMLTMMTIS